jgi:single-stranded-DNA-specific exonuclease
MEKNLIPRPPKRWVVSPRVPSDISAELRAHSPLLRQLLFNRGLEDAQSAEAYVSGQTYTATDPFMLKDMEAAVALLHEAIEGGFKIAIYGDYDVDGVTSSAVLFEFLKLLGNAPRVYIPNRFDEGYGLNLEAIRQLKEEGTDLIITVDCGVRSVEEVRLARDLGMQVIVSDHHEVGAELPPANAVLNPKQPGDPYPYKKLAGVGLAYKLVQAYLQTWPSSGIEADHWLELVALGTIADVAPLDGENRYLVKQGLRQMRATQRQGLYSLLQVAGSAPEKVEAGTIGYVIGPRLNAAGRLDSALAAFELLTSTDLFQAGSLAQQLDQQNADRKDMTQEIQTQALQAAMADPDALLIFSASPEFNEGVIGLAASRVTETMYRPSMIGNDDGKRVKASCRSIAEFHITHALDRCSDLLETHGGHSVAAGFTVKKENLAAFLERMNEIAAAELGHLDLKPVLVIDYEVALDKLRPEHIPGIFADVAALQPTGNSNPDALFCSRGLTVKRAHAVGDGQHLKLILQAGKHEYDAIAFRQGYWLERMPEKLDIAYTFETNTYQGRTTMQLKIEDIKASEN